MALILSLSVGLAVYFLSPALRRLTFSRGMPRPGALQWSQALLFLAGAIRSGSTLDDALRHLSENAAPALRHRIAGSGWERGLSPRARVERMLSGDDTSFARAALMMSLESGGRVGRVLETAAATLQSKGEAEERVRALTAQARASAWIVGLSPVALVALMAMLSSEMVAPLFMTRAGHFLLVTSLAFSTMGLFLALRLSRVEV